MRLATEEDETNSSSYYNETELSQTSNSTVIAHSPPPPPSSSSYFLCSSPRPSYFNSAIETAIKHHLHDDEPIPFIDDNVSTTHSRKSSACWSDRTSLNSRFGLAWKFNLIRSGLPIPPPPPPPPPPLNETGIRRFKYRTIRYVIPPLQQLQFHDEL